jgi:capsular polysaccharide biosynthesis protein
VLALTLIGGSAGLVYGVEAPPTFTARAYVVATGGSAGSTGGPAALAGVRPDAVAYAHAYGRIATSGPVLAQAASVLGTDTSGLDDVKASTFSDAPVIEVAASARSATRAQYLANAVAHALAGYGSDDESELNLTVLAPATAPARPSSPDPPCELVIGTSAGMLTGALAALVSLLSSRRPRRPRFVGPVEIDGHLGIWRARSSTPS